MPGITPFLWFDDRAEEAAEFYVSLFPNSKIVKRSPMVVEFELDGHEVMALNGGGSSPLQTPSDPRRGAIALYIDCATQAEVDRLWACLADGGTPGRCGWIADRYGVVWNIVPQGLGALINGDDPVRAQRAFDAMMQMDKLDIDELRRAYDA